MNDSVESPYKTPSADLIDRNEDNQISHFNRFSAWGVFGLGFITLGIYTIYWLCSRAYKVNAISENKIEPYWMIALIISLVLSFASSFIGSAETAAVISLVVTVVYLVAYVAVAFKLKNRLTDMMNNGSNNSYKLSGVLTFLFSAIYLQYKINEYIDNSNKQEESLNSRSFILTVLFSSIQC